jgi:hypothetical protein
MNYIEDADQGIIPAKQMPDYKGVAEQLKARGMGRKEIEAEAESLGLNSEGVVQLLKEFPEEEVQEEAPVEPSTKTFIASNPSPLPREENPVQTPTGSPTETTTNIASDLTGNMTFSGSDLLGSYKQPSFSLPEMKEQVFIASQLTGETLTPERMEQEVESFAVNDFSPLVSSMESATQGIVKQVEEQVFMGNLTDDPVQNSQMMRHFVTRQENPPQTKQRKILEDYYTLLPKERVVPDDAFSFLATQVDNLNNLSTAASIIAKPLEDKMKFVKDISETLAPIYGEALFLDMQTAISEDNFDVAMQYLVGSNHLDKVQETYWSLDAEGQAEYLNTLATIIQEAESASGTDNAIFKLDLISKIFDKIAEGPTTQGEATGVDALATVETFLSELAIAAPIFKVVKESLRARRVSRILGTINTSPVDLLEKPKSYKGEWFGKDDPFYENTGSGKALDVVIATSPSEFKKLTSDRDIKDVTDSMGVDAADMPRRILPRVRKEPNEPQADGVNHHYLTDTLQRKIDNNHLAIQLQEAEVNGLLPSFVSDLAIELGAVAVPHLDKSYFEALDNPTGDSLGSFVVRLGQGADKGFNTAEDARTAASRLYGDNVKVMRKTPYGNFSEDLMEGTNAYGEYYIELRQVQATTARNAKGNFLGDEQLVTGGAFKPVLNYVIDDDLLFNDKIQRTYSNIRDRANAFGVELGNQAEDLIALATRPDDIADFNELAIKLQDAGLETTEMSVLTGLLGREPSKKVVKALESARIINRANWAIKNRSERAVLVSERFKTALIGEQRFIAKPLVEKPNVSSIKGKEIYDPESNTAIPLTQEIVDGLYDAGGTVAVLNKNATTDTGQYTHIIVRNPAEQIQELQPDVLPYVKGHYQRTYKDDGFVVTGVGKRKVNGVVESETIALGIAQTKWEAERLAVGLANRGHTLTRKSVVPTGEYALRHGFRTTGAFSLEQSQSRGQLLKGLHGEEVSSAELVNPYDTFVKTLIKTRNKFEQDSNSIMKQRWVDRYRSILKTPQFPADITMSNKDFIFKDRVNNEALVTEATNFFRNIAIHEGGDAERMANWINGIVRRVERITDEKGMLRTSKALSSVQLQKLSSLGVGYAATRFIIGNPLFQVLGQIAQAPMLLAQGPVTVAKSLTETVLQFVPLMIARESGDTFQGFVTLLAKEKGVSEERLLKELQTIVDSGIVRTANVSQDFQTEMDGLIKSLISNKFTRTPTALVNKTFKLPIRLFQSAVVGSIDMYELLGFMVAKNLWLKANKGKDWTTAKAMDEIQRNARSLTFNQNDTARFAYQNSDNLLRYAMAMKSYANRMFIRSYLDPLTLGLFSKAVTPKGGKKVNMYARTPAVALGAVAIGAAQYGESYFDPLDGDFNESEKEYLRTIAAGDFRGALDEEAKRFFEKMGVKDPSLFLVETYYRGLQSSSMNALFDGDVNWNEKFSGANFAGMMYEQLLTFAEGNFKEAVLGLPYAAMVGSINTTKHMAKMALASEELDSEDNIFIALEMASQLKIVDDAVAAYMAVKLGRRVSKSTLSMRERTTLYEALAPLAGGVPTGQYYGMISMDKTELMRIDFDTFTNAMIRKTQFNLYNAFIEKGEDLTESEATEIVLENFKTWAAVEEEDITREKIESYRRRLMVPEKPYKYGDITITTEIQEQGVSAFKRALDNDYSRDEWKEKVQERIGILETERLANPNDISIQREKRILEGFLKEIYNRNPEELNRELIEEYL